MIDQRRVDALLHSEDAAMLNLVVHDRVLVGERWDLLLRR